MDEQQNQYPNYNSAPSKPPKKPMGPGLVVVCVICGMIMFLGFWYILFSQFFGNLFKGLASIDTDTYAESTLLGDTVDVLYVEGTISEDSTTYQHTWTLNTIDELMNSDSNKGIFLYVNSPGGGVYESDELYLKLKDYKELTGRPVYAYMAQTAASGGLYVTMAADKIYANRMTLTGSIGVIMSLTDTSGLEELIGIKQENITSGPNKAMGAPLNEEQRAIIQSIIDENYDVFVSVVSEGRDLDEETVRKIADGRVYSAKQAKELKIIDEIGTYEEAMGDFLTTYGLENCDVYHQSPPISTLEKFLMSFETPLDGVNTMQGFTEIKEYIEENKTPKLMYYMES